jgi:hypothetical protein
LAQTEFFHTRVEIFQNQILLVKVNSLDVQNILFKKTDFTKSGSKTYRNSSTTITVVRQQFSKRTAVDCLEVMLVL